MFSEWLALFSLRECMLSWRRSLVLQAGQVWEKFHTLRTSTDFRERWDEIFTTEEKAPTSVFQYICACKTFLKGLYARAKFLCLKNTTKKPVL